MPQIVRSTTATPPIPPTLAGRYAYSEWMRSLNRKAGSDPTRLQAAAVILAEIVRQTPKPRG